MALHPPEERPAIPTRDDMARHTRAANRCTSAMTVGVLPVPPAFRLPTQITGTRPDSSIDRSAGQWLPRRSIPAAKHAPPRRDPAGAPKRGRAYHGPPHLPIAQQIHHVVTRHHPATRPGCQPRRARSAITGPQRLDRSAASATARARARNGLSRLAPYAPGRGPCITAEPSAAVIGLLRIQPSPATATTKVTGAKRYHRPSSVTLSVTNLHLLVQVLARYCGPPRSSSYSGKMGDKGSKRAPAER
jgi:hypothetical protein